MKRLFLNGHPCMNWPTQDDLSPHLAIVQIYGLGIGTQDELAKVFGINEKSVYNYMQAFSIKGAHGLIPQKSGPKGNLKLNTRVRSKILFIESICVLNIFLELITKIHILKNKILQKTFQMSPLNFLIPDYCKFFSQKYPNII